MSLSKIFTGLISILLLTACTAQSEKIAADANPEISSTYNADLAAQLGADDYGMRSYVMAVLKTGPMDSKITDEAKRQDLFAGHFANMAKLAAEKKLVLAGPFIDGGEKRGLYIFNVMTIEQARALVETDPAVTAGIFTAELTKYYGSAALLQVNDVHRSIQKTKIE